MAGGFLVGLLPNRADFAAARRSPGTGPARRADGRHRRAAARARLRRRIRTGCAGRRHDRDHRGRDRGRLRRQQPAGLRAHRGDDRRAHLRGAPVRHRGRAAGRTHGRRHPGASRRLGRRALRALPAHVARRGIHRGHRRRHRVAAGAQHAGARTGQAGQGPGARGGCRGQVRVEPGPGPRRDRPRRRRRHPPRIALEAVPAALAPGRRDRHGRRILRPARPARGRPASRGHSRADPGVLPGRTHHRAASLRVRRGRAGRSREPALRDGRRRDERRAAAQPRSRTAGPGARQPRGPALRGSAGHRGDRPHRGQRPSRRAVAARLAQPRGGAAALRDARRARWSG